MCIRDRTQSDVSIYDLTGKMILNPQVEHNQIDISSLPTGFYYTTKRMIC
jgi:hypothetical protein